MLDRAASLALGLVADGNSAVPNSLTGGGKHSYHEDMRLLRITLLAFAVSALCVGAGHAQSPPQDDKAKLIAKVDEKFASGEQNFKAGHLEAARRDFDAAVDLMLASGYDVERDPELHELFRKVVDTVYAYELQAFHAGDGFQETPAVPAPIDEVARNDFPGGPTFEGPGGGSSEEHLARPAATVNDEVLSFLNFFQTPRGKAIVETGLTALGQVSGDDFAGSARRRRTPGPDLPGAGRKRFPAGWRFRAPVPAASGNLCRGAGNEYGLKRSWWVDERQDPEKATRAAAQHLRDLYGLFGDWYLAMAAYNCGPGNVQKGIERTGYADFWELYRRNVLPRETKNYVPIILALTLIAKDAAHYGDASEPDQPVPSDMVKPGRAIDLRLVAETIDVDVETLRSLNPSLLRMATPDDPRFELHLPKGTAQKFSAEIADIPADKWVSWRRHRVEAGETLTSLAKKYQVTAAAIAAANSLGGATALAPGEKLIIPARSRRPRPRAGWCATACARAIPWGIADQFSVSPRNCRKWNAV